uniref:Enoyl Coenzyme A hydratase domain containing 2 n=1 Tax=Mus musculus TaxID=10090 RepID=E0CYT3_MOUSE
MLRVLPRALRLPCSWRFSGARDCASHATTRTPEIQVQALTGPNQAAGSSGPASGRPASPGPALQKCGEGSVLCRCRPEGAGADE